MTTRRSPELLTLGAPEVAWTADEILTQTDVNADAWWRDCAWRGIEHLASIGQPFTTDDLEDLGVPDSDHPNRLGALTRAARLAGLIKPVGYTTSRRPARHGGVLRVWVGVAA